MIRVFYTTTGYMGKIFKKLLVMLPVVLLGLFYLYDHLSGFRHLSGKRLLFFMASMLVLYSWMAAEALFRRQDGLFSIAVQSSFFVYIFMVLTLTGYFIFFREAPSDGWWDQMMTRIDRKDHVNLDLFQIFRHYELSHKQILGNLVMLMPLGLYLPLLYRVWNVFVFILVSMLFSILIETLQLVTRFRSADVDDVLLNTAGALAGYLIFRVVLAAVNFSRERLVQNTVATH